MTKEKMFIDVALAEYSELRAELRETISKQFTVLSATFTILASLFTFGVTLMSSENETSFEFISIIFYVIIPCFSMFSGILWLDYVSRQVKIGVYISLVETKINNKFVNNEDLNNSYKCPMFWEHYADKEAHKPFFLKSNHWNYYFSMALYIGLPIISICYLKFVKKGVWYPWCYITLFVALCFFIFLLGYLNVINSRITEINDVSLFSKEKNNENIKDDDKDNKSNKDK